jgi:outer membrane biosynthesis protein TonB
MNELGPEARAILDAGRAGDEPTGDDRRRMRASIMRAIATGAAVGAASTAAETSAAAGLKAGAASAWKVVAGLLLAGAVASAGAAAVHSAGDAPPHPTAAAAPVASARTQPPALPPPDAPAPAASEAPAPDPVPAAPTPPPAPVPAPAALHPSAAPVASARGEASASAAPAPQPPPEDPLAAESRGLGAAYRAMQDGDPRRALALLDEQQAKGSALREEREAARVLALCQAGRVDEGRAAAARFLQASPRSPLADRVRGACAARETR